MIVCSEWKMAQIHPYQVKVPDIKIETLKRKLKDATYIQDVEFADDWDYGAPLSVVKRLAARWADGFDWRAAEAEMNQLPQFTTRIHIDGFEDLEMHFVHQKSSQEDSIPLLFAHGCLWLRSSHYPANTCQGQEVSSKCKSYYPF